MHVSRLGRRCRAAGLMAPYALLLQGCAEGPGGTGAWLFVSLALGIVAAACYALGRAQATHRHRCALRSTRAEARRWRELSDLWAWRTDTRHQLCLWQGPGASGDTPGLDGTQAMAGFFARPPAGASSLEAALAAERGFGGLRVQCSAAEQLGGRGWLLHGRPCFDDAGRFDGFIGSARLTDADDALRAPAQALGPLLAACPAAVAIDDGSGLVLWRVSPAVLAQWPAAAPGTPLATWLQTLPPTLAAASGRLQPGEMVTVAGWQLSRFDTTAGMPGQVLVAPVTAAVTAAAVPPTISASDSTESDAFSFTVSHDLRAPIRVVEGFTRIVKEDYGQLLDRVGNDHLDRVLSAAARMNLMIDALLTLARLSAQPLARQPVNLSQLASYVIDDLRRSAPERQADIEIEPGLQAHGDPTLLRLVLENLLGNAWKYTARCPRAHIVFRHAVHDGGPAFEVRDNGAGFDMHAAERLFGLFQRLHSANDFPGHGVGLASVKRIVRRHGGEIWAEAEAGRGAAFHFTLAA